MIEQTKDYRELIPPSNPDYPWNPNWQLLCYYCNQPIEMTKPWAGARQCAIWNWEHVFPSTAAEGWTKGSKWHCDPAKLRPTGEIDDPRCTCGTQEKDKHKGACSACGKPPYHATPFNNKEQELIGLFGWTRKSKWTREKAETQRVTVTEAVGAFTIAGTLFGLIAWAVKALPLRRSP